MNLQNKILQSNQRQIIMNYGLYIHIHINILYFILQHNRMVEFPYRMETLWNKTTVI